MAKKRVYGEGSVTQRKDGRYQVSVPGPDGKRRYGYADSQKDAEKLRRQMLTDSEQGRVPASKQLFQVHAREWLEMRKRGGGKPNSYISAVYQVDGRFVPALGHIPLNKLTPAHIQKFYHQLLDEGLSPNTIRDYHTTLKTCLDSAVKQRKIEINPANHVELPKKKKPKNNHLSQEDALRLLEAVKDNKLFSILVPLALATEARESELLALTWDDIDMENGVIKVQRTVTRVRDEDGRLFLSTVTPKSESGIRDISLPQFAIDTLRTHKVGQIKRQLSSGRQNKKNLVVPAPSGNYYWPESVTKSFARLARKLGFDITFHDLRHTGATLLLESGVDANTVKERLGHSHIGTTLGTYGHVTKKMKDKSIDTLDSLFAEPKKDNFEAI